MQDKYFFGECMDKTLSYELADKTAQKEKAKSLAFAVLVEGRKVSEVAADYNVSRQTVEHAVKRIERQSRLTEGIPDSWVSVSVSLPVEFSKAILWVQEQEKFRAGVIVRTKLDKPILSVEQIELLADLVVKQKK